MAVVECDGSWGEAWDEYVRRSPDASFYHLYGWRQVNEEEFGHRSFYLAAVDGGRISGIFPIVQVKSRLFGNLSCSMPFVNFGGPCADLPEHEEALVAAAAALVKRERLAYLEMRNRRRVGNALPASEHKVSMTLDLDRDPDVLWKAFKTDHRRDIRRAYKDGFVARIGGAELLDPFYSVLSETWRCLGTPLYRKEYFARVLQGFPSQCRICIVMAGEEPAAAAFDAFHGDTVEGMWLGIREKYRRRMAGYVLYWELIKNACERGMRRFHLGRSTTDSGAETFKRKWNAYATQLYWEYLLGTRQEIPRLNVANPRFRAAIQAWRRLPAGLTARLGPMIARSIP